MSAGVSTWPSPRGSPVARAAVGFRVFQETSRYLGADQTSAFRSTICTMATLTIRTDQDVERALSALTQDGTSRSDATRAAILKAERALRRARLRAEAEELRNDPDDVAASLGLAAEMEGLRAW